MSASTKWLGIIGLLIVVTAIGLGWRLIASSTDKTRPALASAADLRALKESPMHSIAPVSPLPPWNRFRGPNGTGLSTDSAIPSAWSQEENLLWQTELPGIGSSSPVLSKDLVFVTSYTGDRADSGEMSGLERQLYGVNRLTGTIEWQRSVASEEKEDPYVGVGITEHGYATNTPVVSQDSVFVFFGKSGVFRYSHTGELIWHSDVGVGSNPKGWGSTSSPIVFEDLVIVNAAEESSAIVALRQADGKEVWRAEGTKLPFTFSTPALVSLPDGHTELVLHVLGEIWGLDPRTGKLLWFAKTNISGNVSPCVIVSNDEVFAYGGYRDTGSLCVQAGGTGDVTKTRVRWQSKLTSYITSPVLVGERLYWVDYQGKFFCQDAKTGEQISRARMPSSIGGGNPVYASMIAINDTLLVQSRRNGVFVLAANEELNILSHNILDDESSSNATPAVAGGQLFLRSNRGIACIQAN